MKQTICNVFPSADAYILPFASPAKRHISLGKELDDAIDLALEWHFQAGAGEVKTLMVPVAGKLIQLVFSGFGEMPLMPRKLYLNAAKAFRMCKDAGAECVAVALDNLPALCEDADLFETVCRLPLLVNYANTGRKTNPKVKAFREVCFVSEHMGLNDRMQAAIDCAEGTVIARTLCNQPASFQTPHSLAEDAAKLGAECGFSTEILEQPQIEALGMDSFLSVARGAKNTPPALIVMRYLQGGDAPVVGYVGKGLVYDSGGYSLKSNANMKNMFDDMGGAAAVIGAMSAIARQKLPVNIIGVVAACENKLSYDSYVPGDIIGSMAGKSIEVTNTDAEGRLTLADAITYAIRKEGCDVIVDIATLTGAAKAAVGKYSSAVISNDDALYTALQKAAYSSSEKVWRLDADEEMRSCLNSAVADIKNASGATTDGGGCILGGLFLQEFVEKKRWIHIDMAGVNFRAEPPAFTTTGATGYGAALLFYLARELPQYLKT